MMNKRGSIYMDISMLQTVPYSNMNSTDVGSPKTGLFGGVTRARISSQCQKKVVRDMFREYGAEWCGIRSLKLPELLAKTILEKDVTKCETEQTAKEKAETVFKAIDKKLLEDEKKKKSKDDILKMAALTFVSHAQIQALADCVLSGNATKEDYINALTENISVDMAFFGRFLAACSVLNIDACAQIAHAMSTHEIETEYDYYTAVDDVQNTEHAGAANIGNLEFESATFYRYATVNITQLADYVGDMTVDAINNFVESFVKAMPSGKQNSYANHTLPFVVYVTIRKDQPINFAGSFEKPVMGNDGYENGSVDAMVQYVTNLYETYDMKPEAAWVIGKNPRLEEIGVRTTFPKLLEELRNTVGMLIAEE